MEGILWEYKWDRENELFCLFMFRRLEVAELVDNNSVVVVVVVVNVDRSVVDVGHFPDDKTAYLEVARQVPKALNLAEGKNTIATFCKS